MISGRSLPLWKRTLDIVGAGIATLLSAPFLLICLLAVWLYDRRNPFYVSQRVGLDGRQFAFVKIRTMVPDAAASGVDTTVVGDQRVTRPGLVVRRLKFDELPQFWHVLRGEMSLVGPRPNVPREAALYTDIERGLLSVPPGITDYASVVFSDLAELLAGCEDANLAYNQLVRPRKSLLGLHYIATASLALDLKLVLYTITQVFARNWTLGRIAADLRRSGAPPELVECALRRQPLTPCAPPGADDIVTSRIPVQAGQPR